jgi:hypothetical protein
MPTDASSSHDLQAARRGWVEPLLNTAAVFMLIGPVLVALGWSLIDSLLDQI